MVARSGVWDKSQKLKSKDSQIITSKAALLGDHTGKFSDQDLPASYLREVREKEVNLFSVNVQP